MTLQLMNDGYGDYVALTIDQDKRLVWSYYRDNIVSCDIDIFMDHEWR